MTAHEPNQEPAKDLNKVLVVDDSPEACETLVELLSDHFAVQAVSNPQAVMATIKQFQPQLILLDYLMPGVSGLEVCKQIRSDKTLDQVPVLFVSGIEGSEDRVRAFEAGANDFIPKPYSIDELVARMKVRLSDKQTPKSSTCLQAGNLKMDLISRDVTIEDKTFKLTVKQFDILKLLVENANQVVTRKQCLDEVWGEVEVTSRNIDSQINYLKKKLEGFNGTIMAVPSIGYRLVLSNS